MITGLFLGACVVAGVNGFLALKQKRKGQSTKTGADDYVKGLLYIVLLLAWGKGIGLVCTVFLGVNPWLMMLEAIKPW